MDEETPAIDPATLAHFPMSPSFAPLGQLAWIDLVGLGLIAVLTVLGLVRGLWWQVIRLAGLLAAVLLARALSPRVRPLLADRFPELPERLGYGITWVGLFLAGLALAALIGNLGKKMLEALQLDLADRVWGALVGGLTGALLHIALVAGTCQVAPAGWVHSEIGGTYSQGMLDTFGHRWPIVLASEVGRQIDEVLRGEGASAPSETDPSTDASKPEQ